MTVTVLCIGRYGGYHVEGLPGLKRLTEIDGVRFPNMGTLWFEDKPRVMLGREHPGDGVSEYDVQEFSPVDLEAYELASAMFEHYEAMPRGRFRRAKMFVRRIR